MFRASRLLSLRAAAAASLAFGSSAFAAILGQYVPGTYVQGTLDPYDQQFNSPQVVGVVPTGITGLPGETQFAYPGIVSPFNPPYDINQVVTIGVGGQITVQFPQPINVGPGSGPTVGVYTNIGLNDGDYPYGMADNPADTLGDETALVSVSANGTNWTPVSVDTFNIPSNYYVNATDPYAASAPADTQAADFGKPFTGTLNSFNGEDFEQIMATLNGSAGGTWLNLSSSGLSQISYIQFSEPSGQVPTGSLLGLEAVTVSNTAATLSTFSLTDGSNFNWPGYDVQTNILANLNWQRTSGTVTVQPGAGFEVSAGVVQISGTIDPFTDNNTSGPTVGNHLAVTVNYGAELQYTQSGLTSTVSSLSINTPTGSQVDLGSNKLVVDYGTSVDPASIIRSYLVSGYNAGTWTGAGIISANAAANSGLYSLGYADANNPADATAAVNAGLTPHSNELVVEYTVAGDVNLDGTVNFKDLGVIAQNFGKSGDWAQGDLNYDGTVNFKDLGIVAQNFGKSLTSTQLAQLPGSFAAQWQLALAQVHDSAASVPEPTSAGVLFASALLLRRRSRKAKNA